MTINAKSLVRSTCTLLAGASLLSMATGCAMFRAQTTTVDVDEMGHYRADYDATDMRKITQSVANQIIYSPWLANQPEIPLLVDLGVENRTSEYVDTKNLTDRMRTLLIQSGKVQFVNAARRDDLLKEQGYQAATATAATQAAIGQQLGANFMLTGSLTEMSQQTMRQVRVSKTEMKYYKLTIELTDLTTGVIAWTTEEEFARAARQPLIGW